MEKTRLRSAGKEAPAVPPVDVRMRMAKECWGRETQEVKATVEAKREEIYQKDLKEYNELISTKRAEGKEYSW